MTLLKSSLALVVISQIAHASPAEKAAFDPQKPPVKRCAESFLETRERGVQRDQYGYPIRTFEESPEEYLNRVLEMQGYHTGTANDR